MAYNGSGVYSPPAASFPAVTGTVIDSAKYNAVVNDIATALTGVITKDGQTTVTANLPMATYRHTGVSDGAALTDYSTVNQVVDNALVYGGASAAGTDTYAVSLPIPPGAYVAGNRYQFIADVANTGACTINFNGLGAKSIKLIDGTDPHDGAIQASIVDIEYDGTNFVLLNPYFTGGKSLVTKAELDILDGATVTTAELNILDGVTLTAAQINKTVFLDGGNVNVMLFQQTTAPTGWTKETTHNDKALRVVSGTASSGGTSAFSTVFGKTATDSHTLITSETPSHTHTMTNQSLQATGASGGGNRWVGGFGDTETAATGGGGGHTHNMDIRVQYVDLILASKD